MKSAVERFRSTKIMRWAAAYLAGAWVLYQIISLIGQNFAWPPIVLQVITILLGFGLVVALIAAWYHGERGEQRVTATEVGMLTSLLVIAGGVVWLVAAREQPVGAPAVVQSRSAADVASVAVLPFDEYSSDATRTDLGAGFTEEIISQLAKLPGLKVISRTSVEALDAERLTVPQIADTLGVRHIVEGSVRRVGNRLRVTVQLIEARSDAHLWAESFDRDLADVFSVQEEIARNVSMALLESVGGRTLSAGAGSRTTNETAYAAYLAGRSSIAHRTRPGLARAIAEFRHAIAADSAFAPAYAGLSAAYSLWVTYAYEGELQGPRALAAAIQHATRAIELDSTLAEGYGTRGYALTYAGAPADLALADLREAVRLKPNSADVNGWYAHIMIREGQFDEGLRRAERAVELDPVAPGRRVGLASDAMAARRYDVTLREARSALTLEPTLRRPRLVQGLANVMLGRANECLKQELTDLPVIRAICLDAAGRSAEANRLIEELERHRREPQYVAVYYARRGNAKLAYAWLRRAHASAEAVDYRLITTGLFDPIRNEPGFERTIAAIRNEMWRRVQRELPAT